MNNNINVDNTNIWILNWKRPETLNKVIRSWLNSCDIDKINVVSNHSSVTQQSIDKDLVDNVIVWRNTMRHDRSFGPLARTINECYVHTFLANKKYCICSHDNMIIQKGWQDTINSSDYDLYFAPQGDQIHIMSLQGLKDFGWWDERYSSNGHHELDYLSRALNKCLFQNKKASLVDIHFWQPNDRYTEGTNLKYNDVGLSNFFSRMDTVEAAKTGYKGAKFEQICSEWQNKKWGTENNHVEGYQTSVKGVYKGPIIADEINWYPWFDVNDLSIASIGY